MEFEFNIQPTPQSLLTVDNIGQVAIEASDDEGNYYYLISMTNLGFTTVATAGPVVPDLEVLPPGYNIHINVMEYEEKKVTKTVYKFLNDYHAGITNAREVLLEEALEGFRNIKEYLKEVKRGL